MDTEDTVGSESGDDLLNDALTSDADAFAQRRAAFQQQLADYDATAEAKPNELAGALTFVISDLLSLAGSMGEALKQSLPNTQATLADFEQIDGRINRYLQVMRQVDRYANLELRTEEARVRDMNGTQANHSKGPLKVPHGQRWPH